MNRILETSINHESKSRMISHQNPKVEFIFKLLHAFFNASRIFYMRFCFHFFILAFIKINIVKLTLQENLVWEYFLANRKLSLNVYLL